MGTEASLGLTYQFHRNIVFDIVGAYLFAGSALDSTSREPDGTLVKRSAKDAHLVVPASGCAELRGPGAGGPDESRVTFHV